MSSNSLSSMLPSTHTQPLMPSVTVCVVHTVSHHQSEKATMRGCPLIQTFTLCSYLTRALSQTGLRNRKEWSVWEWEKTGINESVLLNQAADICMDIHSKLPENRLWLWNTWSEARFRHCATNVRPFCVFFFSLPNLSLIAFFLRGFNNVTRIV